MSVYYADTSAVIKLLIDEYYTSAISVFHDEHEDWDWVSSELLRLEVTRTVRRIQPDSLADARDLLEHFTLIPIGGDIVERAMTEPDPGLRSLDAIHLATARMLGDELAALVTYDKRLLTAASAAGLPVATPTDPLTG